jgi:hypothetical protein
MMFAVEQTPSGWGDVLYHGARTPMAVLSGGGEEAVRLREVVRRAWYQ